MYSAPNDFAALPSDVDFDPDAPVTAPKLLVSVRNQAELVAAIDAAIDIIDLKEPRLGPLAPADPGLWTDAACLLESANTKPLLSAALGEQADANRVAGLLPDTFDFAKVGPSHCRDAQAMLSVWDEVRRLLDDRIELVAVAYADYSAAGCLDPQSIFRLAAKAGFARCLIDTYVKDGRSTLEHLGISGLASLSKIAREAGVWWTLAGSVRVEHVAMLQPNALPDCFGVRGDVCLQGREGILSIARVAEWKRSLTRVH